MCGKCVQEQKWFYHIFCYCPVLVRHRTEIMGSSSLEMMVISRASIRIILALATQQGFSERPPKGSGAQNRNSRYIIG
jgi:hypothetical protein